MKIVFIGTVQFSLKALETLISINANVVGVCTKKTSQYNSDFVDLAPLCKQHDIPIYYAEDINSEETIRWIRLLDPITIFCFGWSSLIKKELLQLPPLGIIGYHPAKLPQNRGRHPLIWALVLGLHSSASTFFFMQEGADDGDILSQVDFEITYEDDASTLYNKVMEIGCQQIKEFFPKLQNNTYQRRLQIEALANIWRKRGKKDGLIDFRMSSKAIYNLVRGLTKPYVGAHIEYQGQDIKIWKVKEIEYMHNNIESGKVLELDKTGIIVKTYDGAVKIVEHEFDVFPKVGEYL